MIIPLGLKKPRVHRSCYIAPGAVVVGDVRLAEGASVWFNAVLRGDVNPITVGRNTNIQDCSVLHVGEQEPCVLGENIIVGHGVQLHGCTVEDGALIGIGAIVLNGAVIGKESLVGAGALVTERMRIPPRSLVLGHPAKVIREVRAADIEEHFKWAKGYVELSKKYKAQDRC